MKRRGFHFPTWESVGRWLLLTVVFAGVHFALSGCVFRLGVRSSGWVGHAIDVGWFGGLLLLSLAGWPLGIGWIVGAAAVNSCMYGAVAAAVFLRFVVKSRPAYLCPVCDYDLSGLHSNTCPGCGTGRETKPA
jgi:hypothetical protein